MTVIMKLVIISLALAIAAVFVYAERCATPDDCNLTRCANGSQLICERQECTCARAPSSCRTRDDCRNTGEHCPMRHQEWHCVDNICRCY